MYIEMNGCFWSGESFIMPDPAQCGEIYEIFMRKCVQTTRWK